MNTQQTILAFFNLQRQIFGVCPRSGKFFRLSDCKIDLKGHPSRDWMDRLDSKSQRLDAFEERIADQEEAIREKARDKGRKEAKRIINRIDRVFTPRRLNPDDAKVIFDPIDYVVFNGMKDLESIKNIIFLDRQTDSPDIKQMQKSIERVIKHEKYEWLTLRVTDDGEVKEE